MNDVTYITTEDIKEITSISNNVEPTFLVPYIRSSEKMHVEDVIGIALDTTLKSAITGGTLTGDNYTLVQYYIKPLAAWSAFLSAIPFMAFKSTSKGILRQSSDNSEIPTIPDINWFRQSVKDNQTFYRGELIRYLEANTSKYPDYRSCATSNTQGNNTSSGIYLGKY